MRENKTREREKRRRKREIKHNKREVIYLVRNSVSRKNYIIQLDLMSLLRKVC